MAPLSYLASVSATRSVLEQYGLMTKKALGQHFLINDGVVTRICDMADLSFEDRVLEVGPGIGTLSVALLQRSGAVVAIERDKDLPEVLTHTCAAWADSFSLIRNDALFVSPHDLPFAPNKLVSNLPYAVAATIVLDYFQRFDSLRSQTVMVQAEVADRMGARVGTKNYGAYTVKLGLFSHVQGRFAVSEGNFFPPPRVKSAVIRLDRTDPDMLVTTAQAQGWEMGRLREATMVMADAAFATRRKTIANSMKTYFSNPQTANERAKRAIPDLLDEAGIVASVRGESLEQEQFIALGSAYMKFLESNGGQD